MKVEVDVVKLLSVPRLAAAAVVGCVFGAQILDSPAVCPRDAAFFTTLFGEVDACDGAVTVNLNVKVLVAGFCILASSAFNYCRRPEREWALRSVQRNGSSHLY